jgi:uncharacterized membrane protein
VHLDYHRPTRRATRRQLWVGLALWIILALLLTVTLLALWISRHDPNAWR